MKGLKVTYGDHSDILIGSKTFLQSPLTTLDRFYGACEFENGDDITISREQVFRSPETIKGKYIIIGLAAKGPVEGVEEMRIGLIDYCRALFRRGCIY